LTLKLNKGVKDLVAEANAEITTISTEEAIARYGAEDVVFVDIRDVRELDREGMVPGAFHAPRGMLEFWVDPDSPYHKEIFASGKTFILYCQSAWRSALATKALVEMGLPNVMHYDSGFKGWKSAGGPVGDRPSKK